LAMPASTRRLIVLARKRPLKSSAMGASMASTCSDTRPTWQRYYQTRRSLSQQVFLDWR
jgi:hypothetical protein